MHHDLSNKSRQFEKSAAAERRSTELSKEVMRAKLEVAEDGQRATEAECAALLGESQEQERIQSRRIVQLQHDLKKAEDEAVAVSMERFNFMVRLQNP